MCEDPDEAWIIDTFRGVGPILPGLAAGIGDDAALFDDGRFVTVDTMVEGVHWDHRLDPEDVGWKLVAVNVSDAAAMGGRPEWAVLALSLPSPLDRAWVDAFARGLRAASARWGVTLVGGDTTRSPVRMASLTLMGRASHPVRRSGGRPGDCVFVTGTLGLAAEGFLAEAPREAARAALRRPEPPVDFAVALADSGRVTAMMDLSDGLLRDLGNLCRASGCGAVVDADAVPGSAPLAWRVGFGEDYELLFTVGAEDADRLTSLATMHGVKTSLVGRLVSAPSAGADAVLRSDGQPWPPSLFSHFAGGE